LSISLIYLTVILNGTVDTYIYSILNSCVIVTNDAWTTEHTHAKNNIMNGSEPKCEQVGNTATVRGSGAIVILHIREMAINPYAAHYEPNNEEQINKEKKDIEESYCIHILFRIDFFIISRTDT
jgi:hypothetical protein